MSKNPWKEYFWIVFSPLLDDYVKRLVSYMEWPAEINLQGDQKKKKKKQNPKSFFITSTK